MLLCAKVCLNPYHALQAAGGRRTAVLKNSEISLFPPEDQRASRCAFKKEKENWRRGSMTVEAALVFPFFLMAVVAFLYLFFLLELYTETGRMLTDQAKKQAVTAYLTGGGTGDGIEDSLVSAGLSSLPGVKCRWDSDTSILTLQASHRVQLPPGLGWFHPVEITQKKTVRGWTGFSGRRGSRAGQMEQVVYVTDYGTVYHRELGCRYLHVSVRQESLAHTESLRSNDGSRYYPCERCWKEGSSLVYLTEEGNRYHQNLNCPGLSRGIRSVLLSETVLPPCSLCGGG